MENEPRPRPKPTPKFRKPAQNPSEERYSLPLRASGFILTWPDTDNPDDVVWEDDDPQELADLPSFRDILSNAEPWGLDERLLHSSPPPLPPPPTFPSRSQPIAGSSRTNTLPDPPASQRRVSQPTRVDRELPAPPGDDSDDNGPEDRREPTEWERTMDRILGFGPPLQKQPKRKAKAGPPAPRKRARPHAAPEEAHIEANPSSPGRRRATNSRASPEPVQQAVEPPAAVSVASRAREPEPTRSFPDLPALDDPFSRGSVAVGSSNSMHRMPLQPARDMEIIDISDDDEDGLPSKVSRAVPRTRPRPQAVAPSASSLDSRLSAGYDDDVIEISD